MSSIKNSMRMDDSNIINTNAVNKMWNIFGKKQPQEKTQEEVDKVMKDALDEAVKQAGRPMTYAELRERFG